MSYSLIFRIDGSFSFFARWLRVLMYNVLKVCALIGNSFSSSCMLCCVM